MAKKAIKRGRRLWTTDDVKAMKQMARAKVGVAKIARALRRSRGATAVKATALGISLSTRPKKRA